MRIKQHIDECRCAGGRVVMGRVSLAQTPGQTPRQPRHRRPPTRRHRLAARIPDVAVRSCQRSSAGLQADAQRDDHSPARRRHAGHNTPAQSEHHRERPSTTTSGANVANRRARRRRMPDTPARNRAVPAPGTAPSTRKSTGDAGAAPPQPRRPRPPTARQCRRTGDPCRDPRRCSRARPRRAAPRAHRQRSHQQ